MKLADFSIPIIEKKFDRFNKLFFENKLTRPNYFTINVSKTRLGYCKLSHKNNTTQITLSSYYEVSEEEMENTLIHEMIHLYQHQVLKEIMNHKDSFKSMANTIAKLSKDKYIITRCNSREKHNLSKEGFYKEERSVKPVIVVFKSNNGGIFFARLCEKLYNNIFYQNGVKIDNILGFIYDKPKNWLTPTTTCRKRLRGKRFSLDEYNNIYAKEITPLLTMKHQTLNVIYK